MIPAIFQGSKFQYTLKISPRLRLSRLLIQPDGSVVVMVPPIFDVNRVAYFVEKHSTWVERRVQQLQQREVIYGNKKEILLYKKQARIFTEERCAYFGKLYGVKPKKITIRAQKSRWGSCSRKGNLNFNYQIVLLPAELADQVIVHELCHLLEFNHSKNFWNLVAKTIPDYRERRQRLKKITIQLR